MAVLTAAVVLVGLLGLLNLLLLAGVVRRLREQSAQLAAGGGTGPVAPVLHAPAGAAIGDFTAVTTTGEHLEVDDLAPGALVGVFSPSCRPCHELLPGFVARAAGADRTRVLAVISGDADRAADLVAALEPVARVVVEADDGPVRAAFGVNAFPSVFTVGTRGRLAAAGLTLSALEAREGVPAA